VGAPRFVSAEALRARLGDDPRGATVLDARSWWAYRAGGHVPGAAHVRWWARPLRGGWGRTGRAPDDPARAARHLAARGVDAGRPVVVCGAAARGHGEEGRVAWLLAWLGHPDVAVLDGGWAAWRDAGGARERRRPRPRPGRFAPRVDPALRADAADVAAAAGRGAVVLDVRSADEWAGRRALGAARAGHVPGAVHLEWRALLDAEGRLDRAAALARLAAAGVRPGRPVVAYCTAGVRSGFAAVALRALGFDDARNYDGSWWDWAADPGRPVARPDDGARGR
jgi:thiosulfate/3-mercaptopyruvate sulfurtransferase